MKIRYEVILKSETAELYEDSDFEEEFKATIQSVKNFCPIFGFELIGYDSFWEKLDGQYIGTANVGFTFKLAKILPLSHVSIVSSAINALSFYVSSKIISETAEAVPDGTDDV